MSYQGSERRKSKRKTILVGFSFFVVVPKKGAFRLPIYDLSHNGLCFDFDLGLGNEIDQSFELRVTEELEVKLYLNQSLFLPLTIKIARIDKLKNDEDQEVRRIGAEIIREKSEGVQAFHALDEMILQIEKLSSTK